MRGAPCGLRPCKAHSYKWILSLRTLYALRHFNPNAGGTMFAPNNICVERFAGVQRGLSLKAPFGASPASYRSLRTKRESSAARDSASASTSASVLYTEKLMRIEHSISEGDRPNAVSAALW